MFLNILENNYFKIILVFVLSIGFLLLFSLFASFASRYASKHKNRKLDDKNIVSRQAKIYEIIFSKSEIKKEELKDYFSCDFSIIENDLKDMIEKGVIYFKSDKYYIKKE